MSNSNSKSVSAGIRTAADIIRSGGVIAYPAETVYGLGCDPLNAAACERIYRIKHRENRKPFLLLANSMDMVSAFNGGMPDHVVPLASHFWPGSLTIVMKPLITLPAYLEGESGGIAYRVVDSEPVNGLLTLLGHPLVSTSANISGGTPPCAAEAVRERLGDAVDFVMPVQHPLSGTPSTIVDAVSEQLAFIREGPIRRERVLEVYDRWTAENGYV